MIDRAETRKTAGEFIRFAIVGVAGALVDMTVLALAFHLLHAGPYLARAISYPIAASFTWAINRRLTFRERRDSGLLIEWARYLAVGAVGGLVNFATYSLVVGVAPHTAISQSAVAYLVPYFGVACGSLAGLIFNFSGAKKLVFHSPPQP